MPAVSGQGGGGGVTEVEYVEATSTLTVTATTEATAQTFITGASHSYSGSQRVRVEFGCTLIQASAGTGVVSLFEDGATIGWLCEWNANINGMTVYASRFFTPASGSHTYSIRAWKTAGTVSLTANTAATKQELPAWYRLTLA